MIKSIDVRFYTIADFNIGTDDQEVDVVEITENQFAELALNGGTIEYERFTIWQNGSSHISLTVSMPEYPDVLDLDVID